MTVGNFDGVHVGHAAIVAALEATARRLDMPAVALTFDPHPASVLRPEAAPVPLTTPSRRAELLAALGVDAVFVQPADMRLMSLPAESFYTDVLRGRLRAAALVEGTDFRFGAGRRGDVALLREWCAADGMAFGVVAPVLSAGEPVSSSRIRSLIAAGDVEAANCLLTAPLRIRGTVVQGKRRGASLGFPTANLGSIATLVPAPGVYAARAAVAGSRITSSRMSSRQRRMFCSVIFFMCGHIWQGRMNSRSGCCTATLSLIEHSVMSATLAGRFLPT